MKKLLILSTVLVVLASCAIKKNSSLGDMVAYMQVDDPIPGVCDNTKVIAILPFSGNGQIEALAPLSDAEIIEKLNTEVDFLKDHPDHKDEGMVHLIVNCKGEMVRCEIDNKTQSPELDKQIVAVFAKMLDWEAGSINGEALDTIVLYSFKINKGVISF